jgi:hypothetical protein
MAGLTVTYYKNEVARIIDYMFLIVDYMLMFFEVKQKRKIDETVTNI